MAFLVRRLEAALEPALAWAARRYQAAVAVELRKYGLRYDDLLDDNNDTDIHEALKRLPLAEVDARNQRLKRAIDTSLKHTALPKDLQAKQTPYAFYLQQPLKQVKEERQERATLGSDMPYSRSIP